jgi:hypothetical protein
MVLQAAKHCKAFVVSAVCICVHYTVQIDSVSHLNPHENALTMNLVGPVRQPYSGVKSTLSPVRDYEFGQWTLHPIPYLVTTESLSFFDQTFSLTGEPGLRTTNKAARQEGKYSCYYWIYLKGQLWIFDFAMWINLRLSTKYQQKRHKIAE